MKLFLLLLGVAFLAASCATEKGNHKNAKSLNSSSVVAQSDVKPTKAAEIQVSTTEGATMESGVTAEVLPIKTGNVVDYSLQESKPLNVTSFITQSGNIYEIKNKNGLGKIQSRQIQVKANYICNYGSVIIYSDLPCELFNNIKQKRPNKNNAKDPNKNGQKRPNQNVQKQLNKNGHKRPNQNAQKRPNKNTQKRPNQNAHGQPNQNEHKHPIQNGHKRPNQNGSKRPNQNAQKPPNQNGQKRPNKNDQTRPIKNGEKRPTNNKKKNQRPQQINRNHWQIEDYDSDEPYQQIQRRSSQALRHAFVYDDYEYEN